MASFIHDRERSHTIDFEFHFSRLPIYNACPFTKDRGISRNTLISPANRLSPIPLLSTHGFLSSLFLNGILLLRFPSTLRGPSNCLPIPRTKPICLKNCDGLLPSVHYVTIWSGSTLLHLYPKTIDFIFPSLFCYTYSLPHSSCCATQPSFSSR